MICGRLREENRDPSNIQVTVSQSGEAEELCLQDVNGAFLRIPTRTSPTPSSEISVEPYDDFVLQEANGFSEEENCLEHVLSSMERELTKTRTELLEAQEEVTCLKI